MLVEGELIKQVGKGLMTIDGATVIAWKSIDDPLLLNSKDKIPMIMTDGKIYRNTRRESRNQTF